MTCPEKTKHQRISSLFTYKTQIGTQMALKIIIGSETIQKILYNVQQFITTPATLLGSCGLGDVGTLRLETVLVGDVDHLVLYTVGTGVVVRALDRKSFVFGSRIFQLSRFLLSNTVAGLIPAKSHTVILAIQVSCFVPTKKVLGSKDFFSSVSESLQSRELEK